MPTILDQESEPIYTMDARDLFDPPLYSDAELSWLYDHVGQVPVVAFKAPLPPGVNVHAVRPVLERVYELIQLEQHEHEPWAGVEAVRQAIKTYQTISAQWLAAHKRSPRRNPRFPSLFYMDQGRRAYRGGVGSDSGRVRTYEVDGDRKYLAIALNAPPGTQANFEVDVPEVPTVPVDLRRKLEDDNEHGALICPVCKFSRNYEPESASSRGTARMQMARHLKSAKKEPDWHRAVYNEEFGT